MAEKKLPVSDLPYCPVALTLDHIGDRWSLLILRDLVRAGNRRYQDLQASLTPIAPNTLSAKLKTLEAAGIIERVQYSTSPPRFEYALTAKGADLRGVIAALHDWGKKHLKKAIYPR